MTASRQVVVHQDDVGMCHGANVAFLELARRGVITSGSVMVPCPWFPEIAAAASADPALDLGVHLTLTAEKEHYRWGPISGPAPGAGLTDRDGYLWPEVASVRRHADPAAVATELRAQVERALAAGIDVTHLDAHMGTALAPEFCAAYLALGVEYRLPILLTRTLPAYSPSVPHLVGVSEADYAAYATAAGEHGLPLFDAVGETPWDREPSDPAEPVYRDLFIGLPVGLSFLALHPNAPGEIEAIEPESAHIRTAEYELFGDARFGAWVDGLGDVELIGMRGLRDAFRAGR
jgi:chitin disaccharide deacetylase